MTHTDGAGIADGGYGGTGESRPDGDGVRAGARAGIPYGIASLLLGVSFGVLARPVMGPAAAIVMSVIVFAGAAQFAALAVLSAGGGAVAAIVAGILLNLRFVPMGIAIAPSLRHGALGRALRGQALIDASWALANRGEGRFDTGFLVGSTLAQYPAWVLGTGLGALAGGAIGDPTSLGLDAIFPAFFLGLLAAELRRPGGRAAGALGAVIAVALIPFAPAGVPIIAAALAAALGLRR
ncbi:MAG TPA: AzlC family ABC transporter permease [Solirubrobacteraceae bacterium]|nr:AzlC family ABC transporter permease [Solirubrobacteraceae bacterium]